MKYCTIALAMYAIGHIICKMPLMCSFRPAFSKYRLLISRLGRFTTFAKAESYYTEAHCSEGLMNIISEKNLVQSEFIC